MLEDRGHSTPILEPPISVVVHFEGRRGVYLPLKVRGPWQRPYEMVLGSHLGSRPWGQRLVTPVPLPYDLEPEVRIPIYSGRVFRREAGHRSDLKPSTIPK